MEPRIKCPRCNSALQKFPRFYYCFKCSKQYRVGYFGNLRELP